MIDANFLATFEDYSLPLSGGQLPVSCGLRKHGKAIIARSMIYFVATSLDGFIAHTDGSVDWLFHDQDYGFTKFFETVETVLQSRNAVLNLAAPSL